MNNTCKYPKSKVLFCFFKKIAKEKNKDFTPKYLASKFNCDVSKISRLKNGERELRGEMLFDMLEYLEFIKR